MTVSYQDQHIRNVTEYEFEEVLLKVKLLALRFPRRELITLVCRDETDPRDALEAVTTEVVAAGAVKFVASDRFEVGDPDPGADCTERGMSFR